MKSEYKRPRIRISGFSKESVLTVSDSTQKMSAQAKAEKNFANENISSYAVLDW